MDALSALNSVCDSTGAYVFDSEPLLLKRIAELKQTSESCLVELDATLEFFETAETLKPTTKDFASAIYKRWIF